MKAPISNPLADTREAITPEATRGPLRIAWPHAILALPGLGLSIYSIIVHNRVRAGVEGACGISQSCDNVIGSKQWGEFMGIPLGVFGTAFFVLVLVTAISTSNKPNLDTLQRLAVATVGVIFSLGLEYVMWVILKEGCPVCISVHIVTFINFAFALAGWLKLRRATATG